MDREEDRSGKEAADVIVRIKSIPDIAPQRSCIPVASLIGQGNDLAQWCRPDKNKLVASGLDWHLVEALPELIAACSAAQAEWQELRKKWSEQKPVWNNVAQRAGALHRELLSGMAFAFRASPELLKKVNSKRGYRSVAKMAKDFSDFAAIGEDGQGQLKAGGFDMGLLEKASEMAGEIGAIYASFRSRHRRAERIERRDELKGRLVAVLSRIREHGKYVHHDNPDRKKGYLNPYLKIHNEKSRRKRKEKAENGAQ